MSYNRCLETIPVISQLQKPRTIWHHHGYFCTEWYSLWLLSINTPYQRWQRILNTTLKMHQSWTYCYIRMFKAILVEAKCNGKCEESQHQPSVLLTWNAFKNTSCMSTWWNQIQRDCNSKCCFSLCNLLLLLMRQGEPVPHDKRNLWADSWKWWYELCHPENRWNWQKPHISQQMMVACMLTTVSKHDFLTFIRDFNTFKHSSITENSLENKCKEGSLIRFRIPYYISMKFWNPK